MKKQISHLSPFQNAKVFAVLMAVSSLVIFLPFMLISMLMTPSTTPDGQPIHFPFFMFLVMPVFQLIFGFIMVLISCALYNWVSKFTGGFEFEATDV